MDLLHTVVVDYRNSSFTTRKFSSNKFNLDIFQDKCFTQIVPVTELEHTYASNNIEYSIENCVYFINEDGEFTLVIWYLRGEINDKSSIGMANQIYESQVDAGRMNYHIIQILLTNANILKIFNKLNTQLNELKFKLGDPLHFQ